MIFVYIYLALSFLATLLVLAICALSSHISRDEEIRELPTQPASTPQTDNWQPLHKRRPIY